VTTEQEQETRFLEGKDSCLMSSLWC